MKKITFYIVVVLATISLQAQQTSFEDAEGYTVGELIDGLNGWEETSAISNYFLISNENSSEGDNSLKMVYDSSQPLIFADWNFPEALPLEDNLEISMDIYAPGGMSTFYWKIKANNEYAAYIIVQEEYVFPAIVNVVNPVPLAMAPINVGAFNEIKLIFNYSAETITYFANGEEIYQGVLWGSNEAIDQYSFEVFLFEDMFMDNLQTNTSLNVQNPKNPQFIHYIKNDNLNLQSSGNMEQIEIYSTLGSLICSKDLKKSPPSIAITSLNPGLYIARLKINEKWHSFKFVK